VAQGKALKAATGAGKNMSRIAELVNNLRPLGLHGARRSVSQRARTTSRRLALMQARQYNSDGPKVTPLPFMRERALTVPTFYLRDARTGGAALGV